MHLIRFSAALCRTVLLVLSLACSLFVASVASAQEITQELSNDTLRLRLTVSQQGVPVIQEAQWKATGETAFRDLGTPEGLSRWVPDALIPPPGQTPAPVWSVNEGEDFTTAEATCKLLRKLSITWVVELPKEGQLIRLHIRLTNRGKKPQLIDSFPIWAASWSVDGPQQVRWWQSLSYTPAEQALSDGGKIRLGSILHSSDDLDGGVDPYWIVRGQNSRIYFGLQWCGGWLARLDGLDNGFAFSALLPPEETQLVLDGGETVDGPVLLLTPMSGTDEAGNRALWMRQRLALGHSLYNGPSAEFPLTYNTWYAVRQNVNDNFLNGQIAAMTPYDFDAFVIDAGWFPRGRWKADPAKFSPGELPQMLASFKEKGMKAGLWTSPQYAIDSNTVGSLQIEQPTVFSKFFGGYLVDLSSQGFSDFLTGHVQTLRNKYSADYWKYDQTLFAQQTRAGAFRNVAGFQNALQAVRKENPDLFIENCELGGRMINEFTLLLTQTSWLKDAGINGLEHARGNINDALNAMEFVFPWAALRFTNNLETMDPNDDELTRLYCRSAMAGAWGISTDLTKVSEHQRTIILKEIENYRRLNRSKYSCTYDLYQPRNNADSAGVTFYAGRRLRAGALVYRWQRAGEFDHRVALPKLKPWATYRVIDVDAGTEVSALGADLINNGVTIHFSAERLSALLLIEPGHEETQ